MGSSLSTSTDDGAARTSAREAWATATRHYFVDACATWRSTPEHALGRIRLVVEGFVHIVCVELEPGFLPHDRGELRRVTMEKAIPIARRHLPPDRRDLVDTLKNLGNNFHHNQGVVQRSTPNMARVALLQCMELLTWMDRELLRAPLPNDYARALAELEGASPVATPLPTSIAAVTLPATAADTSIPAAVASPRPPVAAKASWRPWALLAAMALVVVSGTLAWLFTRPPRELAWVKKYGEAIASRDVEKIVNLHATPSGRFFMTQRQTASQLRRHYETWFRTDGKTRMTAFRDCEPAIEMPDGSRAVRCKTHIEPRLDNGWGEIPTCLVFRSDGLLLSRTEHLSTPAPCPPPPL